MIQFINELLPVKNRLFQIESKGNFRNLEMTCVRRPHDGNPPCSGSGMLVQITCPA